MKKIKNHQRPRRKYRFNFVGHKKAIKIWWDSPFKQDIILRQFVRDRGILKTDVTWDSFKLYLFKVEGD
jgi:hypothetical protein